MAAAVIPFMALLGTVYFLKKKTHKKAALFCKAAATFLPALMLAAGYSEISGGSGTEEGDFLLFSFGWTLAAIVFYMAADVLLECRFVWGAVCFSFGHICMAAGFVPETVPVPWILPVFLFLLFVFLAAFSLRKYIPHLKKLLVPAVLYILILCVMCAWAVSSGIMRGKAEGLIPAAGGVCFLVSDILLGINRLGKVRSRARGAAVLILYYLSVYLFAVRFIVL